MRELIDKVIEWCKVVAKAPLTYLALLLGVLTQLVDDLSVLLGVDHPIVTGLLVAVSCIGIAVRMIRRSTPTLRKTRGVLPVQGPVTSNEQHLARELTQLREVMQQHIEGRG